MPFAPVASATLPIKLHDCDRHGPGSGAELFVVEGDSAAQSVAQLRDARFQAVLPMQGKPLNAWKASERKVAANPFFMALVAAIGADWGRFCRLEALRYERLLLLMDPDADGIHCGALVTMFVYRWMRPVLDAGRVEIVRPPLDEIIAVRRRGLASIKSEELAATCIAPATRRTRRLTAADAQAAVDVFSPGNSRSR